MEDLVIYNELDKNICMSCNKKYPHRILYWKDAVIREWEGINEVKMLFNCCFCRNILEKIHSIENEINELKQEKLNYEFDIFTRKFNNIKTI